MRLTVSKIERFESEWQRCAKIVAEMQRASNESLEQSTFCKLGPLLRKSNEAKADSANGSNEAPKGEKFSGARPLISDGDSPLLAGKLGA